MRRATIACLSFSSCTSVFQSTLSLRRATSISARSAAVIVISIHALLAESDTFSAVLQYLTHQISIHALLAESDIKNEKQKLEARIFQSTLSLRRATRKRHEHKLNSVHFNPRSPCGERRINGVQYSEQKTDFNPRSPCGERLQWIQAIWQDMRYFNPRSPCGERHMRKVKSLLCHSDISIHALLAESDFYGGNNCRTLKHFNPRSPCGERRHYVFRGSGTGINFNPRSPCGERRPT